MSDETNTGGEKVTAKPETSTKATTRASLLGTVAMGALSGAALVGIVWGCLTLLLEHPICVAGVFAAVVAFGLIKKEKQKASREYLA